MSVKTFIRVFFFFLGLIRALTSGRLQKILAWDAAKIAISASSAKINSIETQKNETPLKIKDRKSNRCFLLYLPNMSVLNVKDRKDEGKKIREARSHLKAIMKSIGMWYQNN